MASGLADSVSAPLWPGLTHLAHMPPLERCQTEPSSRHLLNLIHLPASSQEKKTQPQNKQAEFKSSVTIVLSKEDTNTVVQALAMAP